MTADLLERLRTPGDHPPREVATHQYGELPDQCADLRLPEGAGPHPLAMVLHGGFWRARWRRDIMNALCAALTDMGWATWNVEYRRVGEGGGVPTTLDDVAAAYDAASRLPAPVDAARTIVLGHSAGGQLALWLASQRPLSLAVSLAGVSCLAQAATMGVGRGAVRDFCGGMPADVPDAYAQADPLAHLPLHVPQLVVHVERDDDVPVELSLDWARAAGDQGDRCELVVLAGGDHFSLIDPASPAWQEVARRLPPAAG